MTSAQVIRAIAVGDVTAVTLDTTIFDRFHHQFEQGLLSQLSQFAADEVSLVLACVVESEVRAHLLDYAKEGQAKLGQALSRFGHFWGIERSEHVAKLKDLLGDGDAASVCEARWEDFKDKCIEEVVVASNYAKLENLLELYFADKPPFSSKSDKKHEFPDAIALLALEGWAAEKDTMVIAVSADGDWEKYCEGSERLICVKDLAEALSLFNSSSDAVCTELSAQYVNGQLGDLDEQLVNAFVNGRGILVVHTFNEGEELPNGKTKQWVITPNDRKPIAIAVICEKWTNGTDTFDTFIQVTVPANSLISRITDRMPAILQPQDWATWLGERQGSPADVKAVLRTFEGEWTMTEQGRKQKATEQLSLF